MRNLIKALLGISPDHQMDHTGECYLESQKEHAAKPAENAGGGGEKTYYIWFDGSNVTATEGIYDAIMKNVFENHVGINVKLFRYREDDISIRIFDCPGFSYDGDYEITINPDSDLGAAAIYIKADGNHDWYDG